MSLPRPVPLTRRRVLGLTAGALLASACTPNASRAPARGRGRRLRQPSSGAEREGRPDSARDGADPDVALAAAVLAVEQEILDRIEATIARHPEISARLTPARDAHRAHVDLLQAAAPVGPEPSESPLTAATAGGTPARVPRQRRRALSKLARHEDEVAAQGRRAAFAAESGAFARVLASIAAAAAQQSTLMRGSSEGGR